MSLVQRIRHSIAPLDRYVTGVKAMRAAGTYHKYVWWHDIMHDRVDPTDGLNRRNPGHRGPAFLPWHREFLRRFEIDLQNALGDADFGLPYWHWALDKTDSVLATSRVWTEVGGNTGPLSLGGTAWTRMSAQLTGGSYAPQNLSQVVRRDFDGFSNPNFGHVAQIQDDASAQAFAGDTSVPYDSSPWDQNSFGHRGTNERTYHDHVHVLVGGDAGDMSRPRIAVNDPIFFLHHGMIDRIWAHWQDATVAGGASLASTYRPTMSEATGILEGHRLDEPMWPWSDEVEMGRWGLPVEIVTPRDVLDIRDVRQNYVYDDMQPEGCIPAMGRVLQELIRSIGRRR